MSVLPPKVSYALHEVGQNYHDTSWWRSRLVHRVIAPVQQHYYGASGVTVMDKPWDNLIILDGCRADLFEETADRSLFDEYERVVSAGSSTPEWTQVNFAGETFGDTVYVTGNPQISKYAGDAFHDVIEVWDGAFDEGDRIIYPQKVYEATLEAYEKYPNKRLISHFMQPHLPIINRQQFFDTETVSEDYLDQVDAELKELVEISGRETVWSALQNNLEEVLPYVEQLLDEIPGRTVVSSDHGDLLGELGFPFPIRLYGHPSGIRQPELVTVPWALSNGDQREVVDDGTTVTNHDLDRINSHLKNLGYK